MTNDLTTTASPSALSSYSPEQLADYYRKAAEEMASSETRPSTAVRLRNGILSVGDQPIPGNQFAAVVLDGVRLKTYYNTGYSADLSVSPTCYAIARTEAELAPHVDMAADPSHFKAQSERCSGCPMNAFGSARQGNGKACSDRRRIFMLLAGQYNNTPNGWALTPYMDAEHYASTPILSLSIPPTSIKGWGEYVRSLGAQWQRPTFGVVTRVSLSMHPKYGKEMVAWEVLGPTPDPWAPVIARRVQEAQSSIFEGYPAPSAH